MSDDKMQTREMMLAGLTPQAGRRAYEARFAGSAPRDVTPWDKLPDDAKAIWARVEAACRPAEAAEADAETDAGVLAKGVEAAWRAGYRARTDETDRYWRESADLEGEDALWLKSETRASLSAAPPAPVTDVAGLALKIAAYLSGIRRDDSQLLRPSEQMKIGKEIAVFAWERIADAGKSQAARDVLAERRRQVDTEGWTLKHDDKHGMGEMALAAAAYAMTPSFRRVTVDHYTMDTLLDRLWPWGKDWFKPAQLTRERRRDLVKASALLIAEIERLDRAGASVTEPSHD